MLLLSLSFANMMEIQFSHVISSISKPLNEGTSLRARIGWSLMYQNNRNGFSLYTRPLHDKEGIVLQIAHKTVNGYSFQLLHIDFKKLAAFRVGTIGARFWSSTESFTMFVWYEGIGPHPIDDPSLIHEDIALILTSVIPFGVPHSSAKGNHIGLKESNRVKVGNINLHVVISFLMKMIYKK